MPSPFDVIIAGAGPAGSSAAASLAAQGFRVVICDRHAFPREKVCGDALIADAVGALTSMGLAGAVLARATPSRALDVVSPGGREVSIPGALHVLPRRDLDAMLLDHARAAGAEFVQLKVDAPVIEDGAVVGIAGHAPDGAPVALRAPLTVLATGANSAVLSAFDSEARSDASGTAVRAYARARPDAPRDACVIALDRTLMPGYAWAFPAPGGLFNVGVGLFRGRDFGGINLRARLDALLAGEGPIGKRYGPFSDATPLAGAPLRTSLAGSTTIPRRGLAIIGEAAGTTYAATGEGIGKAMENGLLIGELAAARDVDLAALGPACARVLRERHGARFRAYATGQRWVSFPAVVDYVTARAARSPYVRARLAQFLAETDLPMRVFSLRGVWRLLTAK